ncbi:hypothetical protein [Nocardioides caldifontis]|uniref:hypothetical protein n=1 Tax=Nocardioides caldifontis TaxID=2588938 RepID=UPI0011E06DC6|nr:hypothetical protein [Nocardioides caldifontis]
MPRRNYSDGRRRPTGNDGAALRHLAEQMAKRRPPQPTIDTAVIAHRSTCKAPRVITYRGKFGDVMARCQDCGSFGVAPEGSAA